MEFLNSIWQLILALRWGWLVHILNAFVAFGLYSNITGSSNKILENMPLLGWVALLVIGLLFAPIFPFHKMRLKVAEFENTQPNIVFDQCRETPLFKIIQPLAEKQPIYHVMEVWFKNSPITPLESSIAKQVTATVEFWENEDNPQQILRITGVWLKSYAPDFAGIKEVMTTMDILPNDESRKLLIALKWDEDDNCYGYAIESFIYSKTQDGREEIRKLPTGVHLVNVKLRGVGVNDDFWGELNNPGKGNKLTMDKIIKAEDRSKKKGISKKEFHKLLNKASHFTQ